MIRYLKITKDNFKQLLIESNTVDNFIFWNDENLLFSGTMPQFLRHIENIVKERTVKVCYLPKERCN